jgi:hypothetical protein
MAHVSITTRVDEHLLARARSAKPTLSDSELIETALTALAGSVPDVGVQAVYSNDYDENPIESFGEWGDLASFQAARIDAFHHARAA